LRTTALEELAKQRVMRNQRIEGRRDKEGQGKLGSDTQMRYIHPNERN